MTARHDEAPSHPDEEAVFQGIAESLTPLDPPADRATELRDRVLARVGRDASGSPRDLLTVRASEGEWTLVAPLVETKLLFVDRTAQTRSYLVRLGAGAKIDPHQHHAAEECFVLEGELRIGDLCLRAGDYHVAPPNVPHGGASSPTGALLYIRDGLAA